MEMDIKIKRNQYHENVVDRKCDAAPGSSLMSVLPMAARSAMDRKPSAASPFRNGLS